MPAIKPRLVAISITYPTRTQPNTPQPTPVRRNRRRPLLRGSKAIGWRKKNAPEAPGYGVTGRPKAAKIALIGLLTPPGPPRSPEKPEESDPCGILAIS